MQVIGAGIGRTGTLSMRTALSKLLNGQCYHMASIVQDPSQQELWFEWAKDPSKPPRWDAILKDQVAGVDAPICFFYEELMELYPEAKVVLTVRDPERWVASFQQLMRMNMKSAWMGLFSSRARRFGKFARTMNKRFVSKMDRESLLETYHLHNERVRRVVPAERLLEMEVKQGWQPLCDFLGKPVPAEPFPHENEGMATIRRGHWELAFGQRAA